MTGMVLYVFQISSEWKCVLQKRYLVQCSHRSAGLELSRGTVVWFQNFNTKWVPHINWKQNPRCYVYPIICIPSYSHLFNCRNFIFRSGMVWDYPACTILNLAFLYLAQAWQPGRLHNACYMPESSRNVCFWSTKAPAATRKTSPSL